MAYFPPGSLYHAGQTWGDVGYWNRRAVASILAYEEPKAVFAIDRSEELPPKREAPSPIDGCALMWPM